MLQLQDKALPLGLVFVWEKKLPQELLVSTARLQNLSVRWETPDCGTPDEARKRVLETLFSRNGFYSGASCAVLPQPVGLRSPALHIPYTGKLKREPICPGKLGEEWGHMEPPSHKDAAAFLSTAPVLFHSVKQISSGTQSRAPVGTIKGLLPTSERWLTV